MKTTPHGILLIDKARGLSSHDVVRRVRSALQVRRVGHAGTLDPLATGLLIVGVGEGTKLLGYLQAQNKEYEASIQLGVATDTLDAEGKEIDRANLKNFSREEIHHAADAFVGIHAQQVPMHSAVQRDGHRLYQRARA